MFLLPRKGQHTSDGWVRAHIMGCVLWEAREWKASLFMVRRISSVHFIVVF